MRITVYSLIYMTAFLCAGQLLIAHTCKDNVMDTSLRQDKQIVFLAGKKSHGSELMSTERALFY